MTDQGREGRSERRFVIVGKDVLPALLLREGRWLVRAVVFRLFDGISIKRIRRRHVLSIEQGREFLAFREDPMHVRPPQPSEDQDG